MDWIGLDWIGIDWQLTVMNWQCSVALSCFDDWLHGEAHANRPVAALKVVYSDISKCSEEAQTE
jgi:hypothetical protein